MSKTRETLWIAIPIGFYRLMTCTLPVAFRQGYAEEMLKVFHDCCVNAYDSNGPFAAIKEATRGIRDLLMGSIKENLEEVSRETRKRDLLLPLPAAALLFFLTIAASILYIVVYSHLLNPGREFNAYQRHAETSVPYIAFFFGCPLAVLICLYFAKRTRKRFRLAATLLIPLIYMLIDAGIAVAIGEFPKIGLYFAISYAPYFIGAFIGTKLAEISLKKQER